MPRVFEDWEKAGFVPTTPTIEESDASEKARAKAKISTPVPQTNLAELYAELSKSVTESKATAAQKTAELAEIQVDQGEAIAAQAQARENAIEVAAQTGAKIDAKTGMLTPKTAGSSSVPGGVGSQFVEYEYNSDFTKRRPKFFNPTTRQFTYGDWEDNPMTAEQYAKQQAEAAAKAKAQQEKADAFALIEATMRSYGFNEAEMQEIITFIQNGLTNPQMGPNQLALALRQTGAYKTRFAGNETRRARGLNALSEAEYLQQEQDYSATFRQKGLQRFVTREQFANLIGNDISNTELAKRADLAVQRVQYGDPAVIKQLRTYYNITEQDIAAYFLSPKEVLPELEAKTTTAEIGAVASNFGLAAEKQRAEELRAAGVDLARARAGYELISERLPRTQELSKFYSPSGIDYTQTTAEEEEFKGTASAKRARQQLKELEIGSFSGTSGRGLLAPRSSAGAF